MQVKKVLFWTLLDDTGASLHLNSLTVLFFTSHGQILGEGMNSRMIILVGIQSQISKPNWRFKNTHRIEPSRSPPAMDFYWTWKPWFTEPFKSRLVPQSLLHCCWQHMGWKQHKVVTKSISFAVGWLWPGGWFLNMMRFCFPILKMATIIVPISQSCRGHWMCSAT